MQWNSTPNAGFTEGTPWIAVNPNYTDINAEDARADPDSVHRYYRKLIALRSDDAIRDVLVYGEYAQLTPDHESLWAYTRTLGDESLLVVLNFSDDSTAITLSTDALDAVDSEGHLSLVLANDTDDLGDADDSTTVADLVGETLGSWEARVYHVDTA